MQFSRIRLENWRNFSEVDVPLHTRVFLVGANASGKSNFLDVFRFLRDLVTPGGGFQKATISRGGIPIIRNLAVGYPNTDVAIEVDMTEGDKLIWRYRIVFNHDDHRRPILKQERIWDQHNKLVLDRPDSADIEDAARLSQTQLEQTFANREFREIVEFFASISYSNIIPQLVRNPDSYGHPEWQTADEYGTTFIEKIAQSNDKIRNARLRRLQETLKIVVPQLSAIELYKNGSGKPHLRVKFEHWRSNNIWHTEEMLSDGTLRLIAIFWALQETGYGPVLVEEPELSLHPGVVRYLPQALYRLQRSKKRRRQLIVTTHSTDFLVDEGIGANEVLLFLPGAEGSIIKAGNEFEDIMQELNSGLTMADAVLPRTQPSNLTQLLLLDE